MLQNILKNNGSIEPFQPKKLNKWAEWAKNCPQISPDIDVVSIIGQVVSESPETISSKELQEKLIDVASAVGEWSYSIFAGRLYSALLRKEIYPLGIPTVKKQIENLVEIGMLDPSHFNYTDKEFKQIEKMIDHDRDYDLAEFQLRAITKKYALRKRADKMASALETPQMTFMRMALALANHETVDRMGRLKNYYDDFSQNHVNAPTPNYVNLGTYLNGYASCCIFTTKDTWRSIAAADHIAYTMTCMSAGIGGYLNTRSIGDPVRSGQIEHQGKLPYLRANSYAVRANQQAGRGGAATYYYDIFDPEVETLARLKHPNTPADRSIRIADYGFNSNSFFARKAHLGEKIFTFTSFSAPDLHKAFYSNDTARFIELYRKYEADKNFAKNWVDIASIYETALQQAIETGRHYICNIDIMNTHTPFKDPIYSSNLCAEIALPTAGYDNVGQLLSKDECGGEIALCSLAGINVAKVKTPAQYRKAAMTSLLMIDRVIHLSDYPFAHLEMTAKARMSAGVGIVGLAQRLASEGITYDSPEGRQLVHELAEDHYYYLLEASIEIAKERGIAPWMDRTKWADDKPWLPIDTYRRPVDNVVPDVTLRRDWEKLRAEIKRLGGHRFSVLVAHMPAESSSKATGVPNGVYPVRETNLIKTDASASIRWVAGFNDHPDYKYQSAYDVPTRALIDIYAILQKFTDQSISADQYVDVSGNKTVNINQTLNDYFYMIQMGMKTRYYVVSKTLESKKKDEVCTNCSM